MIYRDSVVQSERIAARAETDRPQRTKGSCDRAGTSPSVFLWRIISSSAIGLFRVASFV